MTNETQNVRIILDPFLEHPILGLLLAECQCPQSDFRTGHTEQFHEYLTLYGKNRNEFVVHTDNNPLTYIFSSAHLDAAGHRWVASLANYNFSLEYQKGKDNTVADFLSCMDNCLPEEEVEEALCRVEILAPRVKAMLDNADTPIAERAEMKNDVPPIRACLAETLSACPVKYTTLQVVD